MTRLGLAHLKGLTKLKLLIVTRTNVTKAGVEELQSSRRGRCQSRTGGWG